MMHNQGRAIEGGIFGENILTTVCDTWEGIEHMGNCDELVAVEV
jgi:hypothetical protein